MTKLEQVARAMCERAGTNWSDTSGDEYAPALISRPFWLQQARVAMETLLEQSEAMIVAGDDRILEHLNNHEIMRASPTPAENCFAAMIVAILNEEI